MPASAEGTTTSGPECLAISAAAFWICSTDASEAPPNFQTSSGSLRRVVREAVRATLPAAHWRLQAIERPPHLVVVVGELHRRIGVPRRDAVQRVRVVTGLELGELQAVGGGYDDDPI